MTSLILSHLISISIAVYSIINRRNCGNSLSYLGVTHVSFALPTQRQGPVTSYAVDYSRSSNQPVLAALPIQYWVA